MSFIGSKTNIRYQPGYFLASEECNRETVTVPVNHAQVVTMSDGAKYVPAGAILGGNNSSARGLLYEDVDVSTGAMPGSMVTKGIVYKDRLPAAPESAAIAAMAGITFINNAPSIVRPSDPDGELDEITVASAAGTNVGDTALTITGYTPGEGESYVYKVTTGTPAVIAFNAVPDYSWTAWDGSSDITAATDKKIAVVSIDAEGKAVAYGSTTVTAKANG